MEPKFLGFWIEIEDFRFWSLDEIGPWWVQKVKSSKANVALSLLNYK